MSRRTPKILLVEGHDDLISVIELMSEHIPWSQDWNQAPVHIKNCFGLGNLLDQNTINAALKTPELSTIGIMLDADDGGTSRWDSARHLLSCEFPDLPVDLPPAGLVATSARGVRLGIWIMPDNISAGSLETFLSYLVPEPSKSLWDHACSAVRSAQQIGLPCKTSHLDKARLYTWLAWQDPPGQLSGRALTKKILDPKSATSEPFVSWFRKLFAI